jgi:5-methylcytosine-specific restriction endonuclease McrA
MARVNPALRSKIAKQQGNQCYYCGKRVRQMARSYRGPLPHYAETLDHIIPLSKGGPFAPTVNAVVACHECNQMRGIEDARIFLLKRQGQI